eukprot:TRINITY_DN22863_c0_g1_i2.p3 TRINITY_DN22863_c0_g1~~TRINITY_DN22863_c0_g1_i2.p3  ORF type:complete len:142 (-),score=40.76 TRINITY_DN22863_c0_g1_i2:77-502(-)
MSVTVVPYIGMISLMVQYLYPAFETVRTVLQADPVPPALTQWTVFWIICVSYAFAEQYLLFFLADYLPLYVELKTLAFLWLVHPKFLGAAWLWHAKLKALHAKYDGLYYEKFAQVLAMFGEAGEEEDEAEHADAAAAAKAD